MKLHTMRKHAIIIGALALVMVYSGCSDNPAAQKPAPTTPTAPTAPTTPTAPTPTPPAIPYGCPAMEVYDAQTQQCGVDTRTCPTGYVLNGLTCEQKLVCDANKFYSALRNVCLSTEYAFTLSVVGSMALQASPQGALLECPSNNNEFYFEVESTELAVGDLEILAGTMAGVYQAKLINILTSLPIEDTIPIRITARRRGMDIELVGQVVTTSLPAIPANFYSITFDRPALFPETGEIISGVPGRYGGMDQIEIYVGLYTVSTTC